MVLNTTLFKNTYEEEDGILTNTLSGRYENNRVVTLGSFALYNQQHITELILPHAKNINQYACANLSNCSHIELNWSEITTINQYAFRSCSLWTDSISCGATTIGAYAFLGCTGITGANFPDCTTINTLAFQNCTDLSFVDCPKFKPVDATNPSSAFYNCKGLLTVHFSELTILPYGCFEGCNSLQYLVASKCSMVATRALSLCYSNSYTVLSWEGTASKISAYAFQTNRTLLSLYLLGSTVMGLANVNAFNSTPISTYTTYTDGQRGSIYVPSSLYASYIAATNWITYSARFVSMTDQEIEDFLSSL